MNEVRRKVAKWVHGRHLAVLVKVERVESQDDPWSAYLEPSEIYKLEAAQRAADASDIAEAARFGRVFRLTELTA